MKSTDLNYITRIFFIIFFTCLIRVELSIANDDNMPEDIDFDETEMIKMNDKFEKLNRKIFIFNKRFDKVVVDPTTYVYKKITFTQWGRERITHTLQNLYEPNHMLNSIFYRNPSGFFRSGVRFLINSTLGIFGLFDIATKLGIKRYDISFSDVMAGKMCMTNGQYMMIPILGPSTARNTIGLLMDKFILDPFSIMLPFYSSVTRFGLEVISMKYDNQDLMNQIGQDSIDEYAMLRSLYYQSDYAKEFKISDNSKK